jgi:hypothetical protein
MPEPLDVERELEALRARVRGVQAIPPNGLTPLQKALSGANANWLLSPKFPAPANAPRSWRAVHFAMGLPRRVIVRLLNAIVEQQNVFNGQAARALTELAKENAELRARVEALERAVNEKRNA